MVVTIEALLFGFRFTLFRYGLIKHIRLIRQYDSECAVLADGLDTADRHFDFMWQVHDDRGFDFVEESGEQNVDFGVTAAPLAM